MGVPKFGTPQHAIWTMDGRTWIETAFNTEGLIFQTSLKRGWVRLIDQRELESFINQQLAKGS